MNKTQQQIVSCTSQEAIKKILSETKTWPLDFKSRSRIQKTAEVKISELKAKAAKKSKAAKKHEL